LAAVKVHFAKDYSGEIVRIIREYSVSSTGVEIHKVAPTRVA